MNTKNNKINFKRVIIFIIIAISLSNIFRFDVFGVKQFLEKLPTWIYLLSIIFLEGGGVLIGALVALYLLRKQRKTEISFFGTSKIYSLLMSIIPIILLLFFGVKNEYGLYIYIWVNSCFWKPYLLYNGRIWLERLFTRRI